MGFSEGSFSFVFGDVIGFYGYDVHAQIACSEDHFGPCEYRIFCEGHYFRQCLFSCYLKVVCVSDAFLKVGEEDADYCPVAY